MRTPAPRNRLSPVPLSPVRRHAPLAAALLACCTGLLSALPAHAAPKGTLVYCSEGSPEGFDPARYTTGTTFDASGIAIFNRLIEFKNGTTEIEPGLAERWEVAADGLTVTMHLRREVAFQTTEWFKPTRPFNADDVVFSFDRVLNPENAFTKAAPTPYPYANDTGLVANVAAVKKVDDHTVTFSLKSPDADFLVKVAMPWAAIQSAEYGAQLLKAGRAAQINQQPVGTGPFQLQRYQKDAQIRYKAHPGYWEKDLPKVANLIFAITVDPSVRVQRLKAGECQVMSYPRPADLVELKKNPDIRMLEAPGFNVGYLSYNVRKPPLDKLEVRQALDMSINRQAILDAVFQGQGREATNPQPPGLYGYDESAKNPKPDVAAAKKLLADAGVKEGLEITLWAMPVQRPYNPNARLMAEMIQADWAKIGVKAKFTTYEWGEYINRMKNGEHDTGLMGWNGDYASPDNFLGVLLTCTAAKNGGSNYSGYCNPAFDKLIEKARTLNDEGERAKLYREAIGIFRKDIPWSTIAHSVTNQPLRKNVTGFKISPFSDYDFKEVSVD